MYNKYIKRIEVQSRCRFGDIKPKQLESILLKSTVNIDLALILSPAYLGEVSIDELLRLYFIIEYDMRHCGIRYKRKQSKVQQGK